MLYKSVSHDDVTRFLSHKDSGSKALWEQVKPVVRAVEKELDKEKGSLLVIYDLIILESLYR